MVQATNFVFLKRKLPNFALVVQVIICSENGVKMWWDRLILNYPVDPVQNEFIVYLMIAVLSKEGFIISTDFGIRYQLVQSSSDLKLAGSKNLQIFQLIHLWQFLFVALDSEQLSIEQHCHCIWLLTFTNSLN